MSTSPSQCEVAALCPRKWWFEQIARLRAPDRKPQAFGHALHYVCGSLLLNEDPMLDWADKITDDERRLILQLTAVARQRGILRPRGGLRIEEPFEVEVAGEKIRGRIDCLDLKGGIIEDQKAIAKGKYAMTEDDLRDDLAMMTYGGYLLQKTGAENVVLRHNQFILDEHTVRAVQTRVTKEEVRAFWKVRLLPVLGMIQTARPIEEWAEVSGHEENSEPCRKYGGCLFTPICHHGVPVDRFQETLPDPDGAPF